MALWLSYFSAKNVSVKEMIIRFLDMFLVEERSVKSVDTISFLDKAIIQLDWFGWLGFIAYQPL